MTWNLFCFLYLSVGLCFAAYYDITVESQLEDADPVGRALCAMVTVFSWPIARLSMADEDE